MKLITQYVDPGDATEAHLRLRESGVMTKITIVDPHNMKPSKSGAQRIGLWVVFDDQFEDAVQLLKNSDHVPKRIIALSEMKAIDSAANRSQLEHGRVLLGRVKKFLSGFF